MSISIENLSPISRRATITLPVEQVKKQFNKKLRELASKVRMDGFRPGKIPLNIIERRYGTQAFQEARAEVISESFYNGILEKKIPLIQGSATFELDSLIDAENDTEDLTFAVSFEVYPQIELENINSLKPTRMIIDISDQDIEDAISQIIKVHGSTIDLTEVAQESNIATIRWSLFSIDGEAIASMQNKENTLELGNTKDELLQQIQSHVIGLNPKESKTVEITFSDKLSNKDISGKTLKLELQLEKLQKFEPAEINSDFIKKLGIVSGNKDDFNKEVKTNLVHSAKKISEKRLELEIMSKLSELNNIEEVPSYLISQETKWIKQNLLQQQPELLKEGSDALDASIKERATDLIKRSLLVMALVDKYKVNIDEKTLHEYIQSYVQFMENPQKALETIYSDKKYINKMYNDIMQNLAIKAAIKDADVQEKIYTYKEALDYSATNLS
jgi:trigger factor